MKFAIGIVVTALVVLVQVSAEPIAISKGYEPTEPVINPCEGPNPLVCPDGYHCCPSFIVPGGICFKGSGNPGVCPR
ncbi:hypothetical protein CPB83DRAFT_865410 [Crepidotus variabilis]|uniref:Uncharacterized protein n=1 Tax=Crepidotus variabilis TaxID=179855 RepID=A0A9P6E306_9AGAR|nr:hypothetical protein CPB83DRAFT_865410 [Crepidotus variabilis]